MARIKNINTRIQLKNDTENNWNKAKAEEGKDGFIPLLGEAIVYMGENGHGPRIKIGDGETNVTELPFLEDNDTVYTASNGIEITAENIIQHINNLDVSPSEIGFYKIKYDRQGHINGATAVSKQDILDLLQMTPGRIDSVQITAEAPLVSSNSTENTTNLVTNISFSSQGKNTVLAGPTQSATGAPSFRLLVQDDIPNLSASKITEGKFSAERIDNLPTSKITSGVFDVNRIPNLGVNKITGVIPVSQGGTGVDGVNGNLENNIPSFFNNGVFVYDAVNTRFKQFSITALGNTDTFTSYVNSLNGATENLLIDLDTLIRAIPPMNLVNPAIKYDENQEIKQSYKPSYYSPTTKGIKNSVLISDGDGDSNENGLEPIWLDPTILSTEGHYGGALFYGRDNDSEDLIKPFKTQWGTLPVEQGGTGNTSFNIGQVLIGSGKNSITTIEKTDSATSNTIVQRDINGDFATHSITLIKSLLSESFNTNFPNRNIIDIDNNNIATFFGILNANNLKATIGEIEMSCSLSGDNTKQSKIKWYDPESTTQLIGELYWDNISKRGTLKNYYLSENLILQSDAYYLPEVNTSSTTNNNFTLLATEETASNMFPVNSVLYSDGKVNKITYKNSANGALYSTSVNGSLEWGTLPVAQGGTGVTTIANIQAGKDGDGETISSTYLKLIGGTMTGDIVFASIGDSESTGTANGISWSGSTDGGKIDYIVPSSDLGILRLNVIDDANDRISLRNRNVEYFRVDGSTGATIQGQTSNSTTYNSTNPKLTFMNSDGSKNGQLIWNDDDSQQTPASLTLIGNQGGEYFIAPNIKATGNFYGYLQGTASNNVLKSGDTMTGNFADSNALLKLVDNSSQTSTYRYCLSALSPDMVSGQKIWMPLGKAYGNLGEVGGLRFDYNNSGNDSSNNALVLAFWGRDVLTAKLNGDIDLIGPLKITPLFGEGGEIALDAAGDDATKKGITIDNYYGKFRIFGIPSKDATTHTGYGVTLQYDPYTGILDSTNGLITLVPGYLRPSNPLDIPYGGTGATTPAGARTNLEITPANIGAVSKTGDTMTGSLTIQSNGLWVQGGSPAGSNNSRMWLSGGMPDAFPYNTSKRGVKIYSNAIALADPYNGNGNNDAAWIRHLEETSNSGILEFGVGDDGDESIVARQYNTSSSVVRTFTLLDASGNTTIPGLLNNFKINTTTSLDANDLSATNGLWIVASSIGNAAGTNHGTLFSMASVGTPSEFYIPDSSNLYIYKRWYSSSWSSWSKISAGYSDNAGNADTVDGYHASSLWRSDGAVWNVNANVSCVGDGKWSFDVTDTSSTGSSFWHVWSANLGNSMLCCYPSNGHVTIPYHLAVGYDDSNYSLSATNIHTSSTIVSGGSPAFEASTAAGNWSYLRLNNGSYIWDIASNSSASSNHLEFRGGGGDTNKLRFTTDGRLEIYNQQSGNNSILINSSGGESTIAYQDKSNQFTTWTVGRGPGGIGSSFGWWNGSTNVMTLTNSGTLTTSGSLYVSQNNATGGGIFLADDGSIVDNNDGYCSMRFSYGVRICAGNNTNGSRIQLRNTGVIDLWPQVANWSEGIRIHACNGWATICLCSSDNSGDAGTTSNTWSIHNHEGNFYLSKGGSDTGGTARLSCTGNEWTFYLVKDGVGHSISLVFGSTNFGIKVDGSFLCFRANGTNHFPNN